MTPYSADTGTTLWYHTGSYDINFKYSFSKKWWSHLRRSCSRLQDFSCRRDHDADADAIMKFFTWSKTEKLREWPHDRTQFPADGITTPRLLYIRSLVHDVIKIEVHDRVCVCAPSAGNIDNPYSQPNIGRVSQNQQSRPKSAESARIGRFCRNRQSRPKSAESAEIGRVGRNRLYHVETLLIPTYNRQCLPKSAVSAEIGSICQNWQYLPKPADSAETGRLCQNWHSQWETNSMGHKPSKKRPNVFVILIPHPQCKFINTSHWLKHKTTKETTVR